MLLGTLLSVLKQIDVTVYLKYNNSSLKPFTANHKWLENKTTSRKCQEEVTMVMENKI